MSTQPVPPAVERYLAELQGTRGDAVRAVFATVHQAMPEGYELVGDAPLWQVPFSIHPDTYNGDPLAYVGLADRKNYISLYLMGLYSQPEEDAAFREKWAATGLRLDMGKVCLRFRNLASVDLDLIAETVAGTPVERFIASYERIKPA